MIRAMTLGVCWLVLVFAASAVAGPSTDRETIPQPTTTPTTAEEAGPLTAPDVIDDDSADDDSADADSADPSVQPMTKWKNCIDKCARKRQQCRAKWRVCVSREQACKNRC
jgi:hypothetical protein